LLYAVLLQRLRWCCYWRAKVRRTSRHADTNTNCDSKHYAYRDSKHYAYRDSQHYAYRDSHCYGNTDSYCYCHNYGYWHTNSYCHTDSYCNSHNYSAAYADGASGAHTQAAPDCGAAALDTSRVKNMRLLTR